MPFDLVGVVGADDVGMVELGGGADLAVEAAHGVGVVQPVLADELEGDDAAQLPVAGLEDLRPCRPRRAFQQDVGAEQQVAAAALEELVDLIGRQPAAADQLAGQGAAPVKAVPAGATRPAGPAPAGGRARQRSRSGRRHGLHGHNRRTPVG